MNEKYNIKIGSCDKDVQTFGGPIEANGLTDLKNKVLDQIENLYPLNATPEGAEEYRNRFRGKPIFACKRYEKEYIQIYP